MSQILNDRCEEAFAALLAAPVGALATIFTGKNYNDKTLPAVICSADGEGEEDPFNSGNFWRMATVSVKSIAIADESGPGTLANPKTPNQALITAVAAALQVSNLAEQLSAAVADFSVMAVLPQSPSSGRDEHGVWIDEYPFRIYCCASDLAGATGGLDPVVSTPGNVDWSQYVFFRMDLSLAGANFTTLTFNQAQNLMGYQINGSTTCTAVYFPYLASIADNLGFSVSGMSVLALVDLPALTTCPGGFTFDSCPLLKTLNIPLMAHTSSVLAIIDCGFTTMTFPALIDAADAINIRSNPSMASVSFPTLTLGDAITIKSNPVLTTITAPVLVFQNGFTCDFSGNALTAATVNAILARGIASAAFNDGILNLSGGTNAAPTGQGIADKATLIGRGVTVTTN